MAGAAAPAGGGEWTNARSAAGNINPWLIAFVISISTFMEVLDTSIANVALGHIGGGLSVSYDEATWVLTSYLVANAIAIPASGWLSDTFGRKNYYTGCVLVFTIASFMCGISQNLTFLVLARVIQGFAGGGLQPSTQAMLVDTFPPSKRGQAFAIFGVTTILAPTIGPVLGGVITDNLSWHWIFLINVPVGIASLILVTLLVDEPKTLVQERLARVKKGIRFDYIGFSLIGLGLGCLEITLDRGQREDWWSSPLIVVSTIGAVVGILCFIAWELNRENRVLDISLLGKRNFLICNFVIMVTGVILFGTTQFIPQFLQQVLGYTATDSGLALTAGGAATLIVMPIAALLSNKVQPRNLLGLALVIEVVALWNLTHLNTHVSFTQAALGRVWQAIGIPFLFVPLTAAAYVGLPGNKSNQASALLNMFRNLGGTIGISTVQTMLIRRQQFHQAHMVETLNPLNPNYVAGTSQITSALMGRGQSAMEAGQRSMGVLYQQVSQQAAMLSYIDCFWGLMIFVALVFPTIFLLQPSKGISAAPAGAGAH